jgi:Na+/proline symporter
VDVKQMFLIVGAMVAIIIILLIQIPVSPHDALRVAGAAGRMRTFDFSFNLTNTYTFWSGLIGGTFLMMSYFGTDQSQAQRYLTAKSVDEARSSLLMSAYWKIPLQALVLLIGVLVFVFYTFRAPPLLYNPAHEQSVRQAEPAAYAELEQRHLTAAGQRDVAARALAADDTPELRDRFRAADQEVGEVHAEALTLAERVTGETPRDVNYVIPRFVLHELPLGLAGIFIAAVMAAAMSSIAAELNSLSTATVIDFYRRWIKPVASDSHYLTVSKISTGLWGIFACFVATYAATLGSLIEVVNRFGSFFYGSILGVFLLAMLPRARSLGAFVGLIAGMTAVGLVSSRAPSVSFLWHNVIGALTVVIVGMALSAFVPAGPVQPEKDKTRALR